MKILKKYLIRFVSLLKKTYLYDDFLKTFFSFELLRLGIPVFYKWFSYTQI